MSFPDLTVFEQPIFVMAPPRSGTTVLFDLLAQVRDVWTIGGECHHILESIDGLHPRSRGWESNRLDGSDAGAETIRRLVAGLFRELRDRDGRRPERTSRLCLLEKTPRNCLRLPFFAAAFSDARFVYLHREAHETISSMLDAWRSRRFVSYHPLPGWIGPPWSLLLVPGWRTLAGLSLAEIAARQWEKATTCLLDDLEALSPERWCAVSYARMIADPQDEMMRLCQWLAVPWDRNVTVPLPISHTALDPPSAHKWRRNEEALRRVTPLVDATVQRARRVMERKLVPSAPTAPRNV